MRVRLLLLAAMLVSVAIYWPGLTGPFVLDDNAAFGALHGWLAGKASWQEVVPGNASWLYARPVSMLSFMLSGWLGGDAPFSYKLGNLIVHLICGALGWQVLRRVLARDTRLAPHADLIAALLTMLWLLHPLHASTVLYAVQRMAQLSTLFVLASLWTYLQARQALDQGRLRPALGLLFLLCPLLMLAGLLSKQNGAVAPALCLVLELAYFRGPRPKPVWAFFGLSLVLPLLGAAALLTFAPERLLDGYAEWDFTLGQRLLTQARALVDYLGTLLLPYAPRMGLYTDDFATSTGLLSPPSTLFALLLLTAISVAAIALRKRAPSLFAGWFFFLVAHGVESSFLPIEMYYEHRNYLPSIGVLLAVAGLGALAPRRTDSAPGPNRLALAAVIGLAAVLAFATLGRALVWRHYDTIVMQALKFHPDSMRAHLDLSTLALLGGKYDESERLLMQLAKSPTPRNRLMANLNLVTTQCLRDGKADRALLQRALADAQPQLTIFESQTLMQMAKVAGKGCGEVSLLDMAQTTEKLIDAAHAQPDGLRSKWVTRAIAAEFYARARHWQQAEAQAALAWHPGADFAVGEMLVRLYLHNGKLSDAERTYAGLKAQTRPYDGIGQKYLRELGTAIAQARRREAARGAQPPSTP
ncbi:MAG: hypothetical protein HOQ32_19760 [Lysobacter sp.]|nr:hypothetical protein [Lysobacter sp.]